MNARKEEVDRFQKAKSNNEFVKMLKARTLGPEHVETQMRLRRSVRVSERIIHRQHITFRQAIQQRLRDLEAHFQESKKRLGRSKLAKVTLQ